MDFFGMLDMSIPNSDWTALFPATRRAAATKLWADLSDGEKTASASSGEELWKRSPTLQQKMDAAAFWMAISDPKPPAEEPKITSEWDDPEPEYEEKEASFVKIAGTTADATAQLVSLKKKFTVGKGEKIDIGKTAALTPGQARGLGSGIGALLTGAYGAVGEYRASRPRQGGLSRKEIGLRAKLYERQTLATNEGESPLKAFKRRIDERHLQEAEFSRNRPLLSSAIVSVPYALAGATAGYLTGKRLVP